MTFLDAFIPQLLAALVGGGIGVYGVWLAFRLQRKAATRDGVEGAVENLLLRITDFVAAVDAYYSEFNMTTWTAGTKMQRTFPHVATVSIACELLRLRTTGEEREVADEIGETWDYVAHAQGEKIGTLSGVLAGAISSWRLGESRADVSLTLETLRLGSRDSADDDAS